ncbi:MAG: hypothetical protein AAF252_12690, partial [Pseudomonadota bacterium]
MRMKVIALVSTVMLAAQTMGLAAKPTTYDCAAQSSEGRGFISERIIFTVDAVAGTALVIDSIVNGHYDKPIEAELTMLSNGHIRLNWDVLNLKGRSNTFDVNYRLQYRPNENKFNIRATVRGFD